MYLIIRFLLHINTIIQDEHLRDEHERLHVQLEAAQEHAGMLKRIVDRDVLTGAYSRRYLLECIDELIGAGDAFCLAFLDPDGLKRINDREGHDAGDRYLLGFAQAMGFRLRKSDLLARVGGDEFVVVMPGCGRDTGRQRLEEIRGSLKTWGGGKTVFRFSYGIAASLRGDKRTAEMLLLEADQAMYRDKEHRR